MKPGLLLMLATFFLVTSSGVSAAELTVRVFERGGKAPLQGVAVCLGTSARITQFGAKLTDAGGYVVFSGVPRTSLVLTASGSGYMGTQERITGSGENRMLVLSLPAGGGGAECPLDQDAAASRGGTLGVESFILNGGAAVTTDAVVTLDYKISGHATQYRASEQPDFQGADWLALDASPRYRLSPGSGNKTVYFQVRRYARINGADIETRSSVVHDAINARFR